MGAQVLPAKNSAVVPEFGGGLRYLARQPIMDLRGRVHGYELLFRAGPEAAFRGNGDIATRTMLENTVTANTDQTARSTTTPIRPVAQVGRRFT